MRFVLVGFSVVVAALGVLFLSSDVSGTGRSEPAKSWVGWIWEYANGTYLIERWKRFWDKGGIALLAVVGILVPLAALTMLYIVLPHFLPREALSNFCPHHYIPFAHELKAFYKSFVGSSVKSTEL